LMRNSVDEYGQTTVMVTHDANAAAMADRVLLLADGRIVEELPRSSAGDILNAVERIGSR
jgi:putative ABC transport system ATP-binding protein